MIDPEDDLPVRYLIAIDAMNGPAARRILRSLSHYEKTRGHGTNEIIRSRDVEARVRISPMRKRSNGAELRNPCRTCGAKGGERCNSMRGTGSIGSPHKGRDDGRVGL